MILNDTTSDIPALPAGTTAWVLASGKIGHEVNCLGVAHELGLDPDMRQVRPRLLFQALAPFGPVDPRDAYKRGGETLRGPFPDIVFASGRITVPYLRHVKAASGGRVFTVFMQDPRVGPKGADLIWVPEHDSLRGDNVVVTLTSPHPLRPGVLRAARLAPDPRLASLPQTRVAMVLGGPSANHRFEAGDLDGLAAIAVEIVESGKGLMVTPSRRTPVGLVPAIAAAVARAGGAERAFVWDGTGDNPYSQILAQASAIVVTGDSVNMVGEAASTGAPVHVYEPSGGNAKMTGFIDRLVATGAARRLPAVRQAGWTDLHWTYESVDATQAIAQEIVRRYRAFRGV